jgi:hypothetical protein
VKYLTTAQVARELGVSKQTLLNWLYSGKVPEPPRNRRGHRLWSASRVSLVRRAIAEGRIHSRTVVHREGSNRPDVVAEFAREVHQFLRDAEIPPESFIKELSRLNPAFAPRRRRAAAASSRTSPPATGAARSGAASGSARPGTSTTGGSGRGSGAGGSSSGG